jgi:hypothetical protein
MLPTVDFCGLNVTRLIIGANPFGGYSHQNPDRDEAMRTYYTIPRIKETWARAEAAGINTMVANNETPHVLRAVKEYLADGGGLQWIAQLNCRTKPDMAKSMQEAVDIGCSAFYFHGGLVDDLYRRQDRETLAGWVEIGHKHGLPIGVAGHAPEAHLWVNSLDLVDFHAVCFFNCGSLHDDEGERFQLQDVCAAVDVIQRIEKPCIGYKKQTQPQNRLGDRQDIDVAIIDRQCHQLDV